MTPRLGLVIAAVIALTGCLYGGTIGPSTKQLQRKELARGLPGSLDIAAPFEGEARAARVRVWVDDDFRAQNVRWRAQIEEQIDEVNQFLVPSVGVRLEIAELKPWPVRQSDRTLSQVLTGLEAHDDGKGVVWVIGFTSSLSLVAAGFEELGVARLLGRHIVLRGYADVEERKYFARQFPDTKEEEREVVHQARRRHKQSLVMIHELAHSLGALHERDATWVMHPVYSAKTSQLSERSRELMKVTLEAWLGADGGRDQRALAARLVAFLESNPWGGWEEDELRQWIVSLHQVADAAGAAPASTAPPEATGDVPVPPAAYEQFKRARRLAQQGKLDEALAELDALVSAYPAAGELRQAICEIHVGKDGPDHAKTESSCRRAAEMNPTDARAHVVRVQAYLAAGDVRRALALLEDVAARAGERAPAWDELAAMYQAMGMVTLGERAAARSTALARRAEPHPIAQWAARTRARYGLPPDGRRWRIAVEAEGEYVAAVRELLDLVYAGKNAQVATKADLAERRWKGAPGILAARCDLHLRQGDLGRARALCKQAIGAWPGAAWAQYLSGVIAFQDGKPKVAVVALRKAIEADPELAQAYRALGKTLKVTGDRAGRAALATEYQKRFSSALPD